MSEIQAHRIFLSKEDEDNYKSKGEKFYRSIDEIIKKYDLNLNEILTHITPFMERRNLPKYLALYELFKETIHMPGSIADFGVFMGGSTFTWYHLLETFLPGERMKKIYAFDHFKGYASFSNEDSDQNWVKEKHGGNLLDTVNKNMISELIVAHNSISYLPGVERIVMVDGDINETVPEFVKNNMGLRFSIINLDVNLYEPTKVILEHFYKLLLPGGIIMFSGYTAPPWEGEAQAIEKYFKGKKVEIKKLHFSPYPRVYFKKEEF